MPPSHPRLSGQVTREEGRTQTKSDVKMNMNAREADNCKAEDFQKVRKTTWEKTIPVLRLSFTLQKDSWVTTVHRILFNPI